MKAESFTENSRAEWKGQAQLLMIQSTILSQMLHTEMNQTALSVIQRRTIPSIQRWQKSNRTRRFLIRKHWCEDIKHTCLILDLRIFYNRLSFMEGRYETKRSWDWPPLLQSPGPHIHEALFMMLTNSKQMNLKLIQRRFKISPCFVEKPLNLLGALLCWKNCSWLIYGLVCKKETDL